MSDVRTSHYVTFKILSKGNVKVDYNWEHFFAQMSEWDVEMIRFETGVNIPNKPLTEGN